MKSPLVIRENFDWPMGIIAWLIDLASLVFSAVLCFGILNQSDLSGFWRFFFAVVSFSPLGISLGFTISNWEGICPWVLRHRQTSKSSPPSQSPSLFLNSNNPTPSLNPFSSPSPSRSLPSVTVEQPVVGFRQWQLGGDGRLYPMTSIVPEQWQTTTVAKCGRGGPHPAPQAGCECGLYAHFAPLRALWPVSGSVAGVVLASGRILRHPAEGIRAERMRLLALAHPPLKEMVLERCPARPAISWEAAGRLSPADLRAMGPWVSDGLTNNGYYLLGHVWETEDRELNLPTGVHRFKAKIKCQHCGCGPEREFTITDHTPDLSDLEQIARRYGVPVVPCEKIATYAAEFGIIASEVKALTEAKS